MNDGILAVWLSCAIHICGVGYTPTVEFSFSSRMVNASRSCEAEEDEAELAGLNAGAYRGEWSSSLCCACGW